MTKNSEMSIKSSDVVKAAKESKEFSEIRVVGEHGHGHWHSPGRGGSLG